MSSQPPSTVDPLEFLLGLGVFVLFLLVSWFLCSWYRDSRRFRARMEALPADQELKLRLGALKQGAAWYGDETPGLVLSGGGGKGAYEIGCLEALRDAGLSRCSAVAGTSVGALNAALVAQGDLDAAREIWRTISRGRVLRFVNIFRGSLWRLPLLPFYFFRHLRSEQKRIPPSIWETASVCCRYRQPTDADQRRLVEDFKLVIGKAVGSLLQLLFASLCLALLLGIASLGGSDTRSLQELAELVLDGWKALLIAPGLTVGMILLWFWFVRIDRYLGRSASIASNEPLRQLLAEHLSAEKIQAGPPTFVTVASLRVVDPPLRQVLVTPPPLSPREIKTKEQTDTGQIQSRFRRWWQKHLEAESDFSPSPAAPKSTQKETLTPERDAVWSSGRVAYVPSYLRLQEMSSQGMRERILDSGSLPEFFPRRVFNGEDRVDGGVADNTPLLPLLHAGVRAAVVIYLDRAQGLSDSAARVRQLEQDRGAARPFGSDRSSTSTPLPTITVTLLRIVPSVSLGSMLTGTLNFSAKKAQKLIRLGYADTLDALEAGPVRWTI